MPLDPNIILQSQTPLQLENQSLSLAEMNQRLQLGQQQMQLNNQDLQAAQLQNQMRQMQLNDQQTLRQAFIDSQGDPNQLMTLARQRGVSPATLMQLQTNLLDMKTKAATLDKDTLNNQQSRNDQLQSLLGPVASETDQTKQQAAWNEGMQTAIARGLIPPQEALQHPYPGPDGVKAYVASLNLHNWSLSEQQNATATWRAGLAQNEAANAQNAQTTATLQRGAKLLSQATDPVSYAQAYGAFQADPFVKNNPGLLNYFDAPKDFNAQTSPKRALQAGMTPDQIAVAGRNAQTAAETAQRDAETVRYHNAVIAQGNTRLDQGQERIDQGDVRLDQGQQRIDSKSGANGAFPAAEVNAARKQLDKIHQQREVFQDALTTPDGQKYVDPITGKAAPDEMDDTTRARLQQQWQNITKQGWGLMQRYGGAASNGRIGTNEFSDQASEALKPPAMNQPSTPAQAATPQQAAPAPQKPAAAPNQQTPVVKRATVAQVQAYAKQKNITYAQAQQEFQQYKYQIQ